MQIKSTSLNKCPGANWPQSQLFWQNTFNDIFIDIVVNGLVVFGSWVTTLYCNFILVLVY